MGQFWTNFVFFAPTEQKLGKAKHLFSPDIPNPFMGLPLCPVSPKLPCP
jgi:hypothetical protein